MTDLRGPGGESLALPESVWIATSPPTPDLVPLAGDADADVLIVGAGFTGLVAALELAQASRKVVVIDAAEPGWGASGRNNGQVIPGLKLDPDDVERALGPERGRRMVEWGGSAPDMVFELIARHAIECHPVRTGWIQPAYTTRATTTIESRCAQWAARGASVDMIEPRALPSVLGTPAYVAAWIDRRGGTLNPMGYARGLAGAAMRAGATLHSRTPALSLQRDGSRWSVSTPGGRVRAAKVLIATAGYSDGLVPGLRRSIVPVRTAQVATAPLPASAAQTILPGGQGASDTRRLLTSFRLSPDRRLVMGGAGATGTLDHGALLPRLHRAGAELFRHLGPLQWQLGWSGFFAVTTDHLPHLHVSPDELYCALGCNGRGIAVSSAMGRLVAQRMTGVTDDELPLKPARMRRVAFHEFRNVGIAVATAVKGWQDRAERRRTVRH